MFDGNCCSRADEINKFICLCAHVSLDVLLLVTFVWLPMCVIAYVWCQWHWMCVCVWQCRIVTISAAGPRTIKKHFPNSESLVLYLCLHGMSSECTFDVQNLIWQAKRQKSEGGRSRMELQISSHIAYFRIQGTVTLWKYLHKDNACFGLSHPILGKTSFDNLFRLI